MIMNGTRRWQIAARVESLPSAPVRRDSHELNQVLYPVSVVKTTDKIAKILLRPLDV